jgi:hypothetical protein
VLNSRVDERQYVEDNLRDKSKYGQPDLPFVIAALCDRSLVTERLIEWALYGPEAVTVPIRSGVGRMNEAFLARNPRGLWQRGAEPQVTRVSAVLTAKHVGPFVVASSDLTLRKNPWAGRPLTDDLPWRTVTGDLHQNRLVTTEPTASPQGSAKTRCPLASLGLRQPAANRNGCVDPHPQQREISNAMPRRTTL